MAGTEVDVSGVFTVDGNAAASGDPLHERREDRARVTRGEQPGLRRCLARDVP
jgi:hypothetical protein